LRQGRLALRHGKTVDLFYDGDVYAFLRKVAVEKDGADGSVIVCFNNSSVTKEITVNVGDIFQDEGKHKGNRAILLSIESPQKRIYSKNGKLRLTLPPKSVKLFEDGYALD
jgi:hypothetical protein